MGENEKPITLIDAKKRIGELQELTEKNPDIAKLKTDVGLDPEQHLIWQQIKSLPNWIKLCDNRSKKED